MYTRALCLVLCLVMLINRQLIYSQSNSGDASKYSHGMLHSTGINLHDSIRHVESLLNDLFNRNDTFSIANAYLQLATHSLNLSDYRNAGAMYEKAYYYAKASDNRRVAKTSGEALVELAHFRSDAKTMLNVAKELLELELITTQNHENYGPLLTQIGGAYLMLGNRDSSLYYMNQSLEYNKQINNLKGLAKSYNDLGVLYGTMSDYVQQVSCYLKSLEYHKLSRDSLPQIVTLLNLSKTFLNIRDTIKALNYAYGSADLARGLSYSIQRAEAFNNIAAIFSKRQMKDSAEKYFNLAIALAREKAEYGEERLSIYLIDAATFYITHGDYDRAMDNLKMSLNLSEKKGNRFIAIQAQVLIAQIHIIQSKPQLGIAILLDCLKDEKAIGSGISKRRAYQLLGDAYASLKNFEQAFIYQQKYVNLSDSLMNEAKNKAIQEMDARFQLSDKEKTIQLQQADIQLHNAEMEISRRRNWVLGAGVLAMALIAGLGFILFTTKQKTNIQLLESKHTIEKALGEKNLLLKEIHHRIKNNLQVISSLLKLQSQSVSDDKALAALNEGRNRVQSMALIHQNLYQEDNLTGIYAQDYIVKLTQALFDAYNIFSEKITFKTEIDPLRLDVDTAIPLGLIINELVSNSLKHAFVDKQSGELTVKLLKKGEKLLLEVKDSGGAFDAGRIEKNEKSFGWELVRLLSEKLRASIDIQNIEGTTIRLLIKDYRLV